MARPSSRIEFAEAGGLTDAVSWVNDPDKELADGCALRHTLLTQRLADQCTLTGYAIGDTWLQRYVASSGFPGENYLFDGDDLINRVGRNKAFQAGSLVISRNPSASMKVKSVLMIDDQGGTRSYGHINVSTYSGALDEFDVPGLDVVRVARVNAYEWYNACALVSMYSKLNNDKELRHVMLTTESKPEDFQHQIALVGPEPDGANGAAFVRAVADCSLDINEFNLCIWGRHLKAAGSVGFSGDVEIYVDQLPNPTSISFVGQEGAVKTPLYDRYATRYLQDVGRYYFYPKEPFSYETKAERVFSLDYLTNCFQIQKPKANATRHDILLSPAGAAVSITKQSDAEKKEVSEAEVSAGYLACLDKEWEPIIVNYTYFELALQTMQKYYSQQADLDNGEYSTPRMTEVFLQQIYVPASNRWGLIIRPEDERTLFAMNVIHPSRYA